MATKKASRSAASAKNQTTVRVATKKTIDQAPVEKTDAKVEAERERNAKGGFFYTAAVYILSRFFLTKNRYQNWTRGRRILIGWLLWLIVLPIIPIVAIIVWYLNDPEGFKKSPWAKALIALAVVWAGYAGLVVTEPSQACASWYGRGDSAPLLSAAVSTTRGVGGRRHRVTSVRSPPGTFTAQSDR